MTVTFLLRAVCPVCGGRMRGVEVASGRVNINSIKTTRSLIFRAPCDECGSKAWPDQFQQRLDDESAAKVGMARNKLRQRRKQVPA
jgi:uncharacterized protein with PIN domain